MQRGGPQVPRGPAVTGQHNGETNIELLSFISEGGARWSQTAGDRINEFGLTLRNGLYGLYFIYTRKTDKKCKSSLIRKSGYSEK